MRYRPPSLRTTSQDGGPFTDTLIKLATPIILSFLREGAVRLDKRRSLREAGWAMMTTTNQRGFQSHLVNTKVYKAKFSLVDASVNAKKYYWLIYAVKEIESFIRLIGAVFIFRWLYASTSETWFKALFRLPPSAFLKKVFCLEGGLCEGGSFVIFFSFGLWHFVIIFWLLLCENSFYEADLVFF